MFATIDPNSLAQTQQLWESLIALAVPLLIQGLRTKYPDWASHWWPTLAPILGLLGELCLHYTGMIQGVHPVTGMLLGLTGVGMRELVSKWNTNVFSKQPVPQPEKKDPQSNEKPA